MSHYCEIQTELRDPGALVAALRALGFADIEVHAAAQALYGYQGDARPERAEVIVRRRYVGQAANDLGFARQADGTFRAIISEYDQGQGYDARWLGRLAQEYALARVQAVAKAHGRPLAITRRPDGCIAVRVRAR